MCLRSLLVLMTVLLVGGVRPAVGQLAEQTVPGTEGVGLDNRIGQQIPLDLAFVDENGRAVTLGEYFGKGKPVMLSLVYYDCPMLCNLILDGATRTMARVPQTPGVDYTAVTVSFEPAETPEQARRQRERHLQLLGRSDADWHFLTGSEESIFELADAVGFRYRWDEDSQQYAHPAALTFAQPDGTISRYLAGVEFEPTDLRAALSEASAGKTGTFVDQFIMFCFQYNPATHTYSLVASRLMAAGGVLTLLVLAGTFTFLARRHDTASPLAS